ncbi:MAG TPA: hypothetical protein VIM07_07920 [Chitinophagaceae bacterium]
MIKEIKFISNLSSPFRETEGFRFLSFCLLLFTIACNNTSAYKQLKLTHVDSAAIIFKNERAFASIKDVKPMIQQGDMILRTGNDFTSESLRQLSFTDKTYSHCGIASIENDTLFVYHSLGGEWNPDEKLRRDPLELFCNPEENRGFGIFNFKFTASQINKLDSIVKAWYKSGLMFDMKFDLATNDRMYCAEFVSKAISTATDKQIIFSTTKINKFEFVAVDNLFLNKFCEEKKRIRFQ